MESMERPDLEDSYRLTPLQEGMLFHRTLAGESGVEIFHIVGRLAEALDPIAFRRAWQRVVDRYAIFRSGFRCPGGQPPVQEVHREASLEWQEEDWRDSSPSEQEKLFAAFLLADRGRGIDLLRPPLIRMALFARAEADWSFVWTMYHGVVDGRSVRAVLIEVFSIYEAFRRGEEPDLPPVEPFRRYIEWLERQDMAAAEVYWRRQLAGFRAPTPLGAVKVTRRLQAAREAHDDREIHLSEERTAALEAFCAERGFTFHTLLQGAWALLLGRYGNSRDVLYGCVKSNRAAVPEGRRIIGPLINTLVMRVAMAPEMSLGTLLTRLRAQWLAHREHEFVPLGQVRQWSEIPGDARLFESLVLFENYRWNESLRALGGAWGHRWLRVHRQPEYPLTLYGFRERRMAVKVIYDRRVFDVTTVARMLGHLERVLASAVENPDLRLDEIDILTQVERAQVLWEWNDTAAAWDLGQTLSSRLAAQARRTPGEVAVLGEGRALTYGVLLDRARRLAAALRAEGVAGESLVGIAAQRSPEMVVGLLGILLAGGAYVPLDPGYPAERLAFMLADSGVRVLLTERHLLSTLPAGTAPVLFLDPGEPWERRAPLAEEAGHPDAPAYMIYTSGSTGRPKGVVNTHRGIVNRLLWAQEVLPLGPRDRVLQKTPTGFDVSVWELFWPLLVGARLVLARPGGQQDPTYLARLIAEAEVTTLHFVPSMLQAFLDEPELAGCSTLRRVIASGEPLSGELAARFGRRLGERGVELHNLYGPTEASVEVTWWPVAGETGERPVPIGRPIANTRIRLLAPRGGELPVGVSGELCIGGVQLARGYWRRPDLTAERFVPDPAAIAPGDRLYRTGDLARRMADGTVDFLGRLDHQIKLRGFRIELGEIEATLAASPGVREAVVGVLEAGAEAWLIAWVVPEEGGASDVAAWREGLRRRLPDYMIPAYFTILDALPLTPSGKVDRRALPAPGVAGLGKRVPYVAPRTPVEEAVVAIWQDLLRVERVGVQDPFFDLGGHSLLAIRLIATVRDTFGVSVPLLTLFEDSPTVAGLAEAIERGRILAAGDLPPVGQRASREPVAGAES